jgi:hypothetical protein
MVKNGSLVVCFHLVVDTRVGGPLFFNFPIEIIYVCWYGWLLGKQRQLPQNIILFSFLEEQEFEVGPQGGHPTCPLVTQPTNNPYIGKSCTLQMHMARKLNFSFEDTSNT